jgi:hypothetical protein
MAVLVDLVATAAMVRMERLLRWMEPMEQMVTTVRRKT